MRHRRIPILLGVAMLCAAAVAIWFSGRGPSATRAVPERLQTRIAAGAGSIDVAAETPFEWERMFVFGPYTSRASVEESLGFSWPGFGRTTIRDSDSVCLVVFVQGKRVVAWYEQPRAIDLAELASDEGYTRGEARFDTHRSEGRVILRKPAAGGVPATQEGR